MTHAYFETHAKRGGRRAGPKVAFAQGLTQSPPSSIRFRPRRQRLLADESGLDDPPEPVGQAKEPHLGFRDADASTEPQDVAERACSQVEEDRQQAGLAS
jgi:hypothetical protein